ncbi:MAG: phosphatidylglycerophosphate synthase [Limisphaerales bacterium]|jgi:phosphatidylglycerophosphate synthase
MGWVTWANLLTALRFAFIPGTALAVLFADWSVAAVLFILAVVSDVYDGRLARRFNQQTRFGGIFDHTTDALFVAACCAALAAQGLINPYLWPLILLSFTQYVFDSKVLAGQPLKASIIGRSNGIAYYALAGTAIGAQVLNFTYLMPLVAVTAWLLVLTSLISMTDRALALWRLNS